MIVVTVIRLLRSACTETTSELGKALRTRRPHVVGTTSESSIDERICRITTADRPVPSTITGITMCCRFATGFSPERDVATRRQPVPSLTEKRTISSRPSQKCGTDRPTSAALVAA